jgi:hypothetical protein
MVTNNKETKDAVFAEVDKAYAEAKVELGKASDPVIVHGKTLKRASDYLKGDPFHPGADRLELKAIMGAELVLLEAQVRKWDGVQPWDGERSSSEFALFYGYFADQDEDRAFTFKVGGDVVPPNTRRLLAEKRFPMLAKVVTKDGPNGPYYKLE